MPSKGKSPLTSYQSISPPQTPALRPPLLETPPTVAEYPYTDFEPRQSSPAPSLPQSPPRTPEPASTPIHPSIPRGRAARFARRTDGAALRPPTFLPSSECFLASLPLSPDACVRSPPDLPVVSGSQHPSPAQSPSDKTGASPAPSVPLASAHRQFSGDGQASTTFVAR